MPAQPDELLNDCHFTLYFKQPHVMASYSNLLYLRFLPLGAFIYGPDTSLVKNSEERFGLVFSQPVYSGYLTHRGGKTASRKRKITNGTLISLLFLLDCNGIKWEGNRG